MLFWCSPQDAVEGPAAADGSAEAGGSEASAWGSAACTALVDWYASCGALCSRSPQRSMVFASLWGMMGAVSLAFDFAATVARVRTLAGGG